jgi:hypothetical protein
VPFSPLFSNTWKSTALLKIFQVKMKHSCENPLSSYFPFPNLLRNFGEFNVCCYINL